MIIRTAFAVEHRVREVLETKRAVKADFEPDRDFEVLFVDLMQAEGGR